MTDMTTADRSILANKSVPLSIEKSLDDFPNEVLLKLLQNVDTWKDLKSFVMSSARVEKIYEKNKNIIVPKDVSKIIITSERELWDRTSESIFDYKMAMKVEYPNKFHTTYRFAPLDTYIPNTKHKKENKYEYCQPHEKVTVHRVFPQKSVSVYTNDPFQAVNQRIAYLPSTTKTIEHLILQGIFISKSAAEELTHVFEENQLRALNVVYKNCFYGMARNRFNSLLAAYRADRFSLCGWKNMNFGGSRIGVDPGIDNSFVTTVSKFSKFIWKEIIGYSIFDGFFQDDVEGEIPEMDDRYIPFDNDFICNCKASIFDVGRHYTQITLDDGITKILKAWSNGNRQIEFIKLTLTGLGVFDNDERQLLERNDPRVLSFYDSLNIQPFKGYKQFKSSDGKRSLYMQINKFGMITISRSPFY